MEVFSSVWARVYVAFPPKSAIPQGAWMDVVVERVFHTPVKYLVCAWCF